MILFVFRPLIHLAMICYLQVYLFMTAEQLIMRFLILFEKDKDINEVTYIYNNTNNYMNKEQNLNTIFKVIYSFNILFCMCMIFVVYYEGLDELMNDRLNIDEEVVDIKKIVMYIYVVCLVIVIFFQISFEIHLFYLLYRYHYLEFNRVAKQMATVLTS